MAFLCFHWQDINNSMHTNTIQKLIKFIYKLNALCLGGMFQCYFVQRQNNQNGILKKVRLIDKIETKHD